MPSHGFKCIVDDCKVKTGDNVSFFRCPKDPVRCQQWKDNLGFVGEHKFAKLTCEESHSRIRICGAHFSDKSFTSSGKRLLNTAVPSKLFPQLDDYTTQKDEISGPSIVQTPIKLEVSTEIDIEEKFVSDYYIQKHEISDPSIVQTPVKLEPSTQIDIEQKFASDYNIQKDEISDPSIVQVNVKLEPSTQIDIEQKFASVSTTSMAPCQKPLQCDASIQSGFFQEFVEDVSCQTALHLSEKLPRVLGLKRKIAELQKTVRSTKKPKNITSEDIFKFLDEHYPQEATVLIKNQLLYLSKTSNGVRYSNEYKQFALILFLLRPKAYKKLSKVIRLPSRTTLKRITQHWKIYAGFNEFVFKMFKLTVPLMTEKSKDCIICIDEMSIKPNLFYNIHKDVIVGFEELHNKKTTNIATSALVVMARGISHNWKQPIAYFFCKNTTPLHFLHDLHEIIVQSIRKLKNIGLNVVAVTSDHSPNFYRLVKTCLKLTIEKPYFVIDNSRIFYLFDVPHLLKSTRNNFFSYNFHFDDEITNKCYLEIMYNLDKVKQNRLAPKLTDEHIYPKRLKKMKIKLASEVFSHSVVVAMYTYIDFEKLPADAKATADFIEIMSKLFDMLNSSNLDTSQAFIGSVDQTEFINKIDGIFSNLRVLNKNGTNVSNTLKFIYGWRLTISSILHLWKILQNKNYKFLLTRNLNQDCLENYLGQIRNARGSVRNPTAIQFVRAFKQLFVLNYFHEAEGSNYLEDTTDILLAITPDLLKQSEFLQEKTYENQTPILEIQTSDYQNLFTAEGNWELVYKGGYFLRKCLLKHSCDMCLDYCNRADTDNSTLFCKLESYSDTDGQFGGLTLPSKDLTDYLVSLENIFVANFNNFCIKNSVGYRIINEISNLVFVHPCPNFPFQYLLSLYTRVRIYYTLKFANRELKFQNCKKANPKLRILQDL